MPNAVKKTISLPPDLAAEAGAQAQAEGKTLSAVIQDAELAQAAHLRGTQPAVLLAPVVEAERPPKHQGERVGAEIQPGRR